MIVALAIPPPLAICQLCHAPDGVALPQFAPQLARHAHQRQRINVQLSGCQRVHKHAAPLSGGQVVAGSNPVSPTQVRGTFPVPQRAGVRRCSPVISLGLLSIGLKEASASRRSWIARAWSMGIRPIEDAWAAVAFPDPGSVHADRTVVTQAAREMEMCASH